MNSFEELAKAKEYLRDLTGGGLLLAESRVVAGTLLQSLPEAEWNRVFKSENILKKKSPQTAIRYANAIKHRLEPLGFDFIQAVVNASDVEYKQLLMLAFILSTPVMAEFMQLVVAETKRVYKLNLPLDAWDNFIQERALTMPGLNMLAESTLHKSGSNVIRALVEAGYLDTNRNRLMQSVYLLPITQAWLSKLDRTDLKTVMECTL